MADNLRELLVSYLPLANASLSRVSIGTGVSSRRAAATTTVWPAWAALCPRERRGHLGYYYKLVYK